METARYQAEYHIKSLHERVRELRVAHEASAEADGAALEAALAPLQEELAGAERVRFRHALHRIQGRADACAGAAARADARRGDGARPAVGQGVSRVATPRVLGVSARHGAARARRL